ncbi:hypothetical protein GE09DRAFT_1276675 [Coniochaeta sp. 2T2.1]|nr:hypothetical protein GE09DRAFT_1276675 [Coniochaeta sp. 2T2.1]
MSNCEEVGKQKICQEGKCFCKTPGPPLVCSANEECASLPDCEGVGKEKICQEGQCTCKSPGPTLPPTACTEDGQCASLPDCEGAGKKKICQDAACVCKTEGEAVVSTTITALPPGASIETITAQVTENMVTTTKRFGSDESTVVLIILPVGKPPVICWSCQPERRKPDDGCSTLEYEPKTACETITASTTTTTTTVTPVPAICSPKTVCGGGACPLKKRELEKRAPPAPKGQPNPGSWFGPEQYTNNFEFMRGEVYKAYQDPTSSVSLNLRFEISTGRWARWGQDVKTVALAGLWGCTSVIAVSKRGVWVAHFWEGRDDLVMLTLGDFTGGSADYLDERLGMFRGKPGAPQGDMFDDDAEPQVFILTRRARPSDPLGAPGDVALLTRIRSQLIIPPTYESTDPRYPGDPEFLLFRGKAMVQYQPAIACGGSDAKTIGRQAGYRVWVEAEKLADGDKPWSPSGDTANDPSICTTVDTCSYLECNSGQDRACADGKCQCVEKTCSNVDGCGFISCPEKQEKACTDGKCRCKDTPPPFASGICNTHIRIYGSERSFAANIIWGETITLNTGKLPYEMKYEFLDSYLGSNKKRDRPPPGDLRPDPQVPGLQCQDLGG